MSLGDPGFGLGFLFKGIVLGKISTIRKKGERGEKKDRSKQVGKYYERQDGEKIILTSGDHFEEAEILFPRSHPSRE